MPANRPPNTPSATPWPVDTSSECRVVFVEPDGKKRTVTVLYGQNLMDAALTAGVVGIQGQCGGAINCATCLCDIDAKQRQLLPAQHADEVELLEYVDEASINSRLSCQLIGESQLDGLVAQVVVSIASPDG